MRKRLLIISILIFAISNVILAEDKLRFSDFKISAGETKEINVILDNDESYVAFQFDLYLPNGITIESYSADANRIPESTSLSMSQVENGTYRFIAAAMQVEPIVGFTGSIVKLNVKAAADLAEGELTGFFRNVKLAKADATGKSFAEIPFIINEIPQKEEKVTINNFQIHAGETKDVSIMLDNNAEYVAFQFDLYLPDGLTIESYSADRDRLPENTSLSVSQQSDGSYRFITAAMSGEPIVGRSGSVVNLKIKAVDNLASGEKMGYLRNVKLAKVDATGKKYSESSFTITVVEKTIVTVKDASREYNVSNPTFEYWVSGPSLDGAPEITCEATTASPVGNYTITISKGTVTNEYVSFVNGTLTIVAKSVNSPTIILSETSYTYDGNAKEPIVTVKDGETTIPATEYSVSYANNTNAGTATVTITDVEGGNYTVSGSKSFYITPAAGSITPPTGKSNLVYNGTDQDLILAGSTTTGTIKYSLDGSNYSTAIPQGTDAKTYYVYYRVDGDANHSDIAVQTLSVNISAKSLDNPTITLSETSYTYDGSAKKPTVRVKDGETTIPASEYSISYTNNTNAGTAIAAIDDVNGGNYTVRGNVTFIINKALLIASVGEYTILEGDDIPVFTIAYDGFKNNETADVLTTKPTAKCDATKESKAGEYEITISGGEAKNYIFSYTSGKLIIEAAPSPEPEGTTFDENVGDSSSDENRVTFIVRNSDNGDTPTVALADDNDVTGGFEIPETVIHNSVTYKVTEIAESAFQNNIGLTAVSIPESIASIGEKAFAGCTSLQAITVYITKPINLSVANARRLTRADGSSVFEGVDKETCILYVPEGSVDLYKAAPVWKEFKNILAIGTSTGVKTILNADGKPFDIYDLNGRIVKAKTTSTYGLPKGVYIIDRKKVVVD